MAKAHYSPSLIELQGAPDLFLYELRMFRFAIGTLQNPAIQKSNPALTNVMIESALTHARNLHHFFSGMSSPKDDINAGHFVKNTDGTPWKSSKLPFIESCKRHINKALSHLTYARVIFKPQWDFSRISQDVEDAYAEFLALLPEHERAKWRA